MTAVKTSKVSPVRKAIPMNATSPEIELATAMRAALRRLAKAVVVVTSCHKGQRRAMTATAVIELSMEPPSLVVCVNRGASMFELLAEGADFCVNILHSSHDVISAACSGKLAGEARFGIGDWRTGKNGLPYLADSQASFFCRQARQVDFGTHAIFIGEVFDVLTNGEVDPLVYLDGRYAAMPVG